MDTDLGEELSEGQDLHKADVRLERPGCPNQGTSRLPHIPGDPPPSPPAAALPARCGGGGPWPWPWPCPRCRPPCLCLPRAVSWKRPGSASSPAGWAATRPSPLRPFPVPSLPSRPVPQVGGARRSCQRPAGERRPPRSGRTGGGGGGGVSVCGGEPRLTAAVSSLSSPLGPCPDPCGAAMETLVRPAAGKPPSGRRMKARAPPPPNQPSAASRINNEHKSSAETAVISDQNLVSMKENMINRSVDFTVILPNGVEQKTTVQGSKAVMDLLVDLCSRYHLNPSQYSLELKSLGTEQPLSYKANTLIGALDVQTVLLKEKVPEEKIKRPLPRAPEKSMRLVVNYLKTQKAVVRVSPEVPLHNIIPAICEKCEVSQEHIVLLRDSITGEELELTKSLEELGISELYAWDRKRVPPSKTQSEPSLNYREPSRSVSLSSDAVEKEKKGFLGFFKANRSNSKISQGASLNDLQKKKRRAPLPPTLSAPPTPAIPNRTEEVEDKRKSTMESLLPAHDNAYAVDDTVMELSEVEETASESSCFASEDTTEDSGVVSSPSDIVSLDSQNDSMKSRDIKLVNGYVDSAEADAMCGTETCPVKKTCCSNMGYDSAPQSSKNEEITAAKHENEDVFIDAQLQQTLADLDEDLEAIDVKSNSDSECMSEVLSPHTRKVEDLQHVASSVPVTVIDDVPEVTISNSPRNQETRGSRNLLADSVSTGNFTNKNNNAGSFDKGHTDTGAVCKSKDLLHQQPSESEFIHLPVEQRRDMFESLTSSFEKRSEKNLRLEAPPRHGMKSEECKSKLIPSHSKTTTEISTAKEKINPFNEGSSRERTLKKSKSELEIKWPPAKKIEAEEVPSTPSWCHRAQNWGTNYEPKMGLTTFKVVPPKPEVKHSDRGISVSTGAIKIDELGNLINPKAVVSKNIPGSSTGESEEIPLGKVKEFWRSSSVEKQSDDSAEHLAKKPAVNTNSKSFATKQEHKPVSPAAPKPVAPQTVTSQVAEKLSENEKTKPPLPVTQSQLKPLMAPAVNKDKMELPFLKPHRRTSSQYVASAIAKHINLPTFKPDSAEFHEKDEYKHGAGEAKTEAEVSPKRCIVVANSSPVETESAETTEKNANIFTSSQKVSHRLTPGDNSGMENKVVNIRAPNQATPASFYKKNVSVPLTKSSLKDNDGTEDEHSLNSKQSIAEKKKRLLFDQKCETLPRSNSASSLKSPDLQGVSPPFSSSLRITKWPPADSMQVSSLRASPKLNGVTAKAESEQKDKPDDSLTNAVGELDANVQTNIFGPKKKFKPVVQKPIPKDTSLHSALMEAIQTGGGKEKLRKVSDSALYGNHNKPSYAEPENERSALLAAIRGHSGTSKLKKISSSASEELQSFRNAELSLQKTEYSQEEPFCIPPAPAQPPPPPPPTQLSTAAPKFSATTAGDPGEARRALMEAIRSGAGAAKLKKVPLLV
uniref:Cordon-bleu WH2 repeat protein n=1 Tax=Cairina moschata TaxID=8855 RepID=A0A8C3GQE2_CAIMO